MSDQEIVKALKRGDTSVLKYCYERSSKIVFNMIKSNAGTRESAKDIFHDALLIFYKNCRKDNFELTSSITTYLYSISWRLWLNEQRKPIKYGNLLDESIVEELNFDIVHKTIDDRVKELMQKVQRLGKNCFEILKKYYFQQLSYDEIASDLRYSSAAVVREQKYRCIKRIRQLNHD